MLHTGRNWFHVKNDMSNARSLGSLLGENGYTTFGTGKWHNGHRSFVRSFQQGKAAFFGGMSDHTRVPLKDLVDGKLVNERVGEEFSSELFADAAVDFLRSHRADKPYFCYVALTAPHDPRQPPLKYRQMYYDKRPPLPVNFLPQHPFDNGHMAGGRDENLAAWPRTREIISDQLAEYYGLITHMDEQIGRILAALERSGQADNTYVIFASDHGLALGSHGLLGKQNVYEHSMRCPLIVAGPGVPAGKSSDAFTYLYDLYPTICGLTEVSPPDGLDGYDIKPLWTGEKAHLRQSVFLPFLNIMRAVRDRRWKLIQYPQINYSQLFDLQNDSHEMHNLAADPEHAETLERMFALLRQSQKLAGDSQALTTDDPKRKEIDLTGRGSERSERWPRRLPKAANRRRCSAANLMFPKRKTHSMNVTARWFLFCLVLCGFGQPTAAGPTEPVRDVSYFLRRLRSVDHMPELEQSHTATSSTWDRSGGNEDGFDFKRITKDGRNVLLDVDGPGCIHRIFACNLDHATKRRFTQNEADTRIQIFLDGNSKAVIDLTLPEFFNARNGPFPYPLIFWKTYPGCLAPIPFAKHCRVQLVNPRYGKPGWINHHWAGWWQITYTTYP
ncbi:MAG: sulfatase-like hydrolase/transferase, partial [Pirellulales bacterium]